MSKLLNLTPARNAFRYYGMRLDWVSIDRKMSCATALPDQGSFAGSVRLAKDERVFLEFIKHSLRNPSAAFCPKTAMRLIALACISACALHAGSLLAQPAPGYVAPLADRPMNETVQAKIYPQLRYFFSKLAADKADISIDGYLPFQGKDKFLPGKIAAGLGDVLLRAPRGDKAFDDLLRQYREIADLTVHMDNHSWGIYYYVSTLYKLQKAGLIDKAISPATLQLLKNQLDWRTFVRVPGYELIDLPTNYYGVAFSIARLRALLGWEDDSASNILLNKMLKHYADYSGKFGFSDETPGDGRFDRYSILLIAEICERFVETGLAVTPEMKRLLRQSAVIALNEATNSGEGLTFGRSIGAYGETAQLQILAIAAYVDVLSADEKRYAYAYSTHIIARYVDFWFRPAINSVDLWGNGRRTDAYRGKNRILGENFSLLHQIVTTNDFWKKLGLAETSPRKDLQSWLDMTRPRFNLTWFARGEYDRALAIYRDTRHVFSLLMVNGGPDQHANSPYYPLPFSSGMIAGVADSGTEHTQLVPKFTLTDGSELLGTAYIKDIRTKQHGKQYNVAYRQDELDHVGGNVPRPDARMQLQTEYTFSPGTITRSDRYTSPTALPIERVSLEFISFSEGASAAGNKIHFESGDVTDFEVRGLKSCRAEKTNEMPLFQSPSGPMHTLVTCVTEHITLREPLVIEWTITYR
ncbi:MAG: hypothetical protein ABI846_11060 [Rudaea sp.]